MSRLSLQLLKDKTGVSDDQLVKMCSDTHLKELAENIEDYEKFAHALELKDWQLSDIKTDLNMNYVMKTYAVLKYWKTDNVFKATYERLLNAVLSVGEGVLAIKICELCKRKFTYVLNKDMMFTNVLTPYRIISMFTLFLNPAHSQ